MVSYTALQRLAHLARETIAAGLRRLQELDLLSKIKRRVRLAWANGGQATRQATSAYMLHAPTDTEFDAPTVISKIENLYIVQPVPSREARQALARRREALIRCWM